MHPKNDSLDYMIHPRFRNSKRLLIQSFNVNANDIDNFLKCF